MSVGADNTPTIRPRFDPRTERYLVVNGRRWRRSDPELPEAVRGELVAELMSARRAVAAARRTADAVAERDARERVADAKVALGERGHPWWEHRTHDGDGVRASSVRRALAAARSSDGRDFRETMNDDEVERVISGTGQGAPREGVSVPL